MGKNKQPHPDPEGGGWGSTKKGSGGHTGAHKESEWFRGSRRRWGWRWMQGKSCTSPVSALRHPDIHHPCKVKKRNQNLWRCWTSSLAVGSDARVQSSIPSITYTTKRFLARRLCDLFPWTPVPHHSIHALHDHTCTNTDLRPFITTCVEDDLNMAPSNGSRAKRQSR